MRGAPGWTPYEWLSRADEEGLLEPADLELLARSAYMLARDDAYVRVLERAHHGYLDAGDVPGAARCAWWIGHNLLMRGESARATGWFGRGDRLLDRDGLDCVERGYLLLPVGLRAEASDDARAAFATWTEAAAIGERHGDPDLVTLARMGQGHALVRQGRAEEGFRLVDETMVAVTTGELSPIVAGIVYCNMIAFCQQSHDARRAREWTDALTEWCDGQPDMVAHTGVCLVHRAEVMQLQGDWHAALEEIQHAGERVRHGALNQRIAGSALYRQGEIKRLQGEFPAAEEAYRAASEVGFEPQPGLALLRVAEHRHDDRQHDRLPPLRHRLALGVGGQRSVEQSPPCLCATSSDRPAEAKPDVEPVASCAPSPHGAFMEPSGRNRWQPLASETCRSASTIRRLPRRQTRSVSPHRCSGHDAETDPSRGEPCGRRRAGPGRRAVEVHVITQICVI
jgi:tetratricopeptide (TPR) repeat protein